MVGSSIGGICALGLGTRKWSLEECRMKFLKFTEQIFAPKSCFGRLLSRFTGGWFAILSNVAKLIFFDSIYDSAPIETILQESFGETSLMIQSDLEHPTRVAVVVNQASTSGPTVFANYNKSRHSKNGAYTWPAMNSLYRSLKIWEVARATSAAPGFWDTITLLGSAYQDGGLSHNNPSAIAIGEANVLASSRNADSLIVSVGCGRLFTAPLSKIAARMFSDECKAAARRLIASLFYFELGHKMMKRGPTDQNQQNGVIKTRLTEDEFKAFKQGYPEVKFRVKDLMFDISIWTEVKLWNPNRDTQFKVELVHPSWTQQISGSPFTVAQLLEAQADYLPVVLRNGRKRKRG
ncbi:FabD/lysophospholipase-like protein, partial [Aureobasidium melanogenum]